MSWGGGESYGMIVLIERAGEFFTLDSGFVIDPGIGDSKFERRWSEQAK